MCTLPEGGNHCRIFQAAKCALLCRQAPAPLHQGSGCSSAGWSEAGQQSSPLSHRGASQYACFEADAVLGLSNIRIKAIQVFGFLFFVFLIYLKVCSHNPFWCWSEQRCCCAPRGPTARAGSAGTVGDQADSEQGVPSDLSLEKV